MQTIAVVDDDPKTVSRMSNRLEAEGYRIEVYQDGSSALKGFQEHLPDLVILDLAAPLADGREVLRILRQRSSVPVIFMTSRDSAFEEFSNDEMSPDGFIGKPFSSQLLIERVRALLRHSDPKRIDATEKSHAAKASAQPPAELPSTRYLSVPEQRVFSAALRRSVRVISAGQRK